MKDVKDMSDLRGHLFDQLDRLKEAKGDELAREVEKSTAVIKVVETLISSFEAETTFLTVVQGMGTGFVPVPSADGQKQIGTGK